MPQAWPNSHGPSGKSKRGRFQGEGEQLSFSVRRRPGRGKALGKLSSKGDATWLHRMVKARKALYPSESDWVTIWLDETARDSNRDSLASPIQDLRSNRAVKDCLIPPLE